MSLYRSLLAPAARSLSGHLDRVRANLATIARPMRESVSTALGRAGADAVRQAVAYLMRQAGEVTGPVQEASHGYDARRDSRWAGHDHDRLDEWDDRHEFHWGQDERHWRDSREYEPNDEYPPTRPAFKTEPVWRSALAAACRLIAWLLGRLASPGARLLALGTGLATALTVYLVGSTASPGSLGTLTDTIARGADALARLGGR